MVSVMYQEELKNIIAAIARKSQDELSASESLRGLIIAEY